jgi:hypothetical protein
MRGIIGAQGRAIIDRAGVRLENPLGVAEMLWTNITRLVEAREVLVFYRDRYPAAWHLAAAFSSPAQRSEVVAFMNATLGQAEPTSRSSARPASEHPESTEP